MKKSISIVAALLLFSVPAIPAADLITEKTIDRTLRKMTLEQKARMLVGTPGSEERPSHRVEGAAGWTYPIHELGIPSVNLADGPVGIRINPVPSERVTVVYDSLGLPVMQTTKAGAVGAEQARTFCTCFPSTTALAATWDRDASLRQGRIMGDEARHYGVDVVLTPGINIMRNPLCGRNFEYYSEDPLLTGKMAAPMIAGIQEQGIGTSLKHFVANNQQTGKKYNDARITQRALREIYLKGFEICVKEARPWTVMGSYNKIAGEYTQTNRELLLRLLRDEWGFDGLVLTDWTVRRPTADLLNARCALMMPGEEEIVQEIIEAVESGKVSRKVLDACVRDVLRVVAKSITAKGWESTAPDLERHAAVSREIATEGMVLLKNDGGFLPLPQGANVALFGVSAYKSIAGGTGSSNVNKPYVVDISTGLERAGYRLSDRLSSVYEKYVTFQNELTDRYPDCPDWQKISYHRTVLPEMDLSLSAALVEEELTRSDVAVIVVGRGSGETSDRVVENDFNLTAQEQTMIETVTSAARKQGKRTVVVLNVCGTIETASWRDKPDAILMAWFPGQECGNAVADVLSGKANPSGRLPMTFPIAYADMPSSKNYPYVGQTSGRNFDYTNYEEDIWVGYRYFTTTGRKTAYPFGYGLSYTTFAYSDARIVEKGDGRELTVTVTNTGDRAGKEVVQLYVSAPSGGMKKPSLELKAFAKTRLLPPGASETVRLTIADDDLASFDSDNSQWLTEAGTYEAKLGKSAEDIVLSLPFAVENRQTRKTGNLLAPVAPVNVMEISPSPLDDLSFHDARQFEILGRAYPDSLPLFSRVPAFRKPVTRDALWKLGQHSAGISVRFRSDSPKLALRWESLFKNDMTHMAALAVRGLDLYVRRSDGSWRYLGCGRPMGEPTTWLVVDNMQAEMREYMLHLPLYDGIKSLEIGIKDGFRIGMPEIDSPRRGKPLVIYGTSIAHGATASRPGMAASNQLQRRLDREVINLGFSANARIDHEIAEMMAAVDACAYVLDFLPNVDATAILTKTKGFVDILRKARPTVPLVFVENPQFAHAFLDQTTGRNIADNNAAIRRIYNELKASGMENIHYIDSDSLLPPDGDGTSDGIHFSDVGFETYVDALVPILLKITDK